MYNPFLSVMLRVRFSSEFLNVFACRPIHVLNIKLHSSYAPDGFYLFKSVCQKLFRERHFSCLSYSVSGATDVLYVNCLCKG